MLREPRWVQQAQASTCTRLSLLQSCMLKLRLVFNSAQLRISVTIIRCANPRPNRLAEQVISGYCITRNLRRNTSEANLATDIFII
jgi:hypothetical protein